MSVRLQIQKIHYISKDSSLEKEIQNLLGTSNPIDSIREELFSTTMYNDWARNQDPLINYLYDSDSSSENEPYNYELQNEEDIQNLIEDFKERLNYPDEVLAEEYSLTLGTGATNEYRISLRTYIEVFEKIQNDNQIILVSVNW